MGSPQTRPGLNRASVVLGTREMAAVVKILNVVDGTKLGGVRTVLPSQIPDVLRHGAIWSHALTFELQCAERYGTT